MSAVEQRLGGARPLRARGGVGRGVARALRGDGSLRLGTLILAGLLLGSVVVSALGADPNAQRLDQALLPPGHAGHLLGTDPLGRDVLAWTAGGIRIAVLIGVCVVLIAAAFGVLVGTVAAYLGGWVDALLMRVVDLQLAVPPLILFLAASAVVRPSILGLIVLVSVVSWVPYARLVRTRILRERESGYVAAARLAGSGHLWIVARHLLPSALSIALVVGSLQFGYVVLWEAALSFLGFGVQPPHTSLGFLIAAGQNELVTGWWVVVVPGVAIVLLTFASNLIGEGLRNRLDVSAQEVSEP